MISHFRASIRIVLVFGALATAAVLVLVSGIFLYPFPEAGSRLRAGILNGTARLLTMIVGVRIAVVGPVPDKPFILVANHLGYMDILVLRRVTATQFVSKAEVANWPVVGQLARLSGTLFIDRRNNRDLSRINNLMQVELARNEGITLFPEGTSTAGQNVGHFHGGLLAHAAESGTPVYTATLHYSAPGTVATAQTICWWGSMTFLNHLYNLLRMPHFGARVTFGPHPIRNSDRKELARRARRQILETFEPVEGTPPA